MARTVIAAAAGLLGLITALPPPVLPAVLPVIPRHEYHELSSRSRNPSSTVLFLVTAYCPCMACCGKTDGITATGRPAVAGRTVAVDPHFVILGTRLMIEGLGERVAEDTGGSIRGRHLDIFFADHAEAAAFGSRWLAVSVMDHETH